MRKRTHSYNQGADARQTFIRKLRRDCKVYPLLRWYLNELIPWLEDQKHRAQSKAGGMGKEITNKDRIVRRKAIYTKKV